MTIIKRSALIAWGRTPAPDLAYIVSDHPQAERRVVTWSEVMENRRKWQREILRRKREWFVYKVRAYKLWVAFFDQDLMGGWHTFLEDWRGEGYRIWINRDCSWLEPRLMKAFPLILPLGTERQRFERWQIEFAGAFERRRQHRHPLGVTYVWWDGHNAGSLKPAEWKKSK